MKSVHTREPSIVEKAILRKPFHEATKSIRQLNNSVAFAIKDHYRGHEPPGFPVNNALHLMSLSPAMVIGPLFLLGIGTIGPILAGALVLIAMPLACFALPFTYVRYQRTPDYQLRKFCKKALTATEEMPLPVKVQVRRLVDIAKLVFTLARVCVVQEEIAASPNLPSRDLYKLEEKGLRLIDDAIETLHLDHEQYAQLREDFKAGRLLKPHECLSPLDDETWEAQRLINAAAESTLAARVAPSPR